MVLSNEDFATAPPPDSGRPMLTDESGNAVDLESLFAQGGEQGEPGDLDPQGGGDDDPDFIPDDVFKRLPKEARHALTNRSRAKRAAEQRVEAILNDNQSLKDEVRQLRELVNTGLMKGGGQSNGQRTIQDFSAAELRNYKAEVRRIRAQAMAQPDNEALQAEAAKVSDDMLDTIDTVLMSKVAEEATKPFIEQMEASRTANERQAELAAQLANEGLTTDMLVNRANPINKRARELAQTISKRVSISDNNEEAKQLLSYMSFLVANQENSREGNRVGRARIPENVRRQLDIESTGRSVGSVSARGGSAGGGDLLQRVTEVLLANNAL
jgi:hypothetical protein